MERKVDFSDYQVGDKVWDALGQEWVEIVEITNDDHFYPFRLSNNDLCNLNGKNQFGDLLPRYYPNRFEIPAEAFERPLPKVEVDQKVWVRDSPDDEWKPRHATGQWVDGKLECYVVGRTSHSTDGGTQAWKYYRFTQPTENEK